MRWSFHCSLLSCASFLCTASAGEDASALKPSRFTFKSPAATPKVFLDDLGKQTGNKLVDTRERPIFPGRSLDLDAVTFWHALNKLSQGNARLSPFHTPGAIALIDGPKGPIPVAEDGVFRLSVQRISLLKDVEEDSHLCHLTLLLMWEPRLQPFHMELGRFEASFAGKDQKPIAVEMAAQGKQELTGTHAATLPVRFPAPPRRDFDRIENLKGSLVVVLPTKMSTFRFDKLAVLGKGGEPRTLEQDKVKVALTQVSVGPDRWSFILRIDNPPGVPSFESYQSWLGNNRITLGKDGGKAIWEPLPDDMEVLEETAHRATIRYHFTESKFLSTTKLSDWTLAYVTPHRIVAVPATFELKRIELP